jgi:hypothetical protein
VFGSVESEGNEREEYLIILFLLGRFFGGLLYLWGDEVEIGDRFGR